MIRLNLPDRSGSWALAMAGAVWAGTLAGRFAPVAVSVLLCVAGAAWGWRVRRTILVVIAAGFAAGAISGALAAARESSVLQAAVQEGPVDSIAVAAGDTVPGRFDTLLIIRLLDGAGRRGPPVLVVGDLPDVDVGSILSVRGRMQAGGTRVRGKAVAGTILGARLGVEGPAPNPLLRLANRIRATVIGRVDPGSNPSRALLAGFLVGETRHLPAADAEDLRRSGLSHFVAVSGSNVALFLVLWWALLAPVTSHPVARWMSGLLGLGLFALLTRWEPSVVRACVMAGLLLMGRLLGVPLDAWASLGLAVAGVLLVSGELAVSVGFQLSVAATAGVIAAGAAASGGPGRLAAALAATAGAQLAVAPILLLAFGAIPLLSPVANLAAGPLVAGATVLGGVGAVTGIGPAVDMGAKLAEVVLVVARVSAPWPTVGWLGYGGLCVAIAIAVVLPAWRPTLALVAAIVVALAVWPTERIPRPAVVFLDVGQGDAALVLGSSLTVLVDGGPDPGVLAAKLSRMGVRSVDLVVASHVHADHLEGLQAVVGRIPVGVLWQAFGAHATQASAALLEAADRHHVPVVTPAVGDAVIEGDVGIRVLGPVRRYDSANDESLVVEVEVADRTFLFSGDAETFAQADLGVVPVDVLKVPHQGAATSNPGWLSGSAGMAASVISVGPNDYGHPAAWVVDGLQAAGSRVLRTDEHGDIVIHPEDLPP